MRKNPPEMACEQQYHYRFMKFEFIANVFVCEHGLHSTVNAFRIQIRDQLNVLIKYLWHWNLTSYALANMAKCGVWPSIRFHQSGVNHFQFKFINIRGVIWPESEDEDESERKQNWWRCENGMPQYKWNIFRLQWNVGSSQISQSIAKCQKRGGREGKVILFEFQINAHKWKVDV